MTHPVLPVEIITIGDELLIGQVVDTNSAWMGQQLNLLGIKVVSRHSVGDDRNSILEALNQASQRARVVLITGGLGPTKDDITKKTLGEYLGKGFEFNESVYDNVRRIFASRGREVTPTNRSQAEVISGCTVLNNPRGTAPGMWMEHHEVIYISLPGVPSEMKGIMLEEVLPRLKARFPLPPILHRTYLTQGIGESWLSDQLETWETALPKQIKLAYLPTAGQVRLRLTASGDEEVKLTQLLDSAESDLMPLLGTYLYGRDEEKLEAVVGQLLSEKKLTLSTAESCTGGYIAHRITSISGSSEYYVGSLVTYANRIKEEKANIDPEMLKANGAVSEPVVRAMAENVRESMSSDYGIATSGIAGPGGGTPEKPVGTVWIAVAGPHRTVARKLELGVGRERVIHETALYALSLLRQEILSANF